MGFQRQQGDCPIAVLSEKDGKKIGALVLAHTLVHFKIWFNLLILFKGYFHICKNYSDVIKTN